MPLRSAVLVVCLLVWAAPAAAWNGTGHMIIALLAWRELPEATRTRVSAVLRKHPHYDIFLKEDKPDGVAEAEWAFLRAATWSDWVRPDPAGKKPGYVTAYHKGNWHYVNLPYIPPAERARFREDDFRPKPPNVVTALEENLARLRGAGTAADDRAVALAWVLHLGGDIHQPLHCTALVTTDYPRGDQGGNLCAVRIIKQVVKLHAYWDDLPGSGTAHKTIAGAVEKIRSDAELSREKLEEIKKNTTPGAWALEGRALAEELVYLKGGLKTAHWDLFDAKKLTAEQVPQLPEDYGKNARAAARKRMALAGFRLADALKAAVGE